MACPGGPRPLWQRGVGPGTDGALEGLEAEDGRRFSASEGKETTASRPRKVKHSGGGIFMRSRSRFGSRWEEPQPAGCAPWELRGVHAGGADSAPMKATETVSSVTSRLTNFEEIPRLRRRVGEEEKSSLDSALEGGRARLRGRHRRTSQSWGSERGVVRPPRTRGTGV